MKWLAAALIAAVAAFSQPGALLNSKEVMALCGRSIELMESTSVAVPDLARASAPMIESARQAKINLEVVSPVNSSFTYVVLTQVRAYLALSDAMPRPHPFPEAAARQFTELRAASDVLNAHFAALLVSKEIQVRSPDRDNLRRYAEANATLGPPQPGKQRVVFYGDSITDGWRLNEYFGGRDFVNRGISGQVTGEMLGRMKADVLDLKPAAFLLLAGTNDLARGVALKTIQNNFTMIADLADKYRIKVILASILPVSDYHKDKSPRYEMTKARPPESIRAMNVWLANFCKQRGYTYLNYYDQLVDSAGFLKAELADDGLHPNPAGYRVMAPIALDAVDRTLAPPVSVAPAQPPPKRKRLF